MDYPGLKRQFSKFSIKSSQNLMDIINELVPINTEVKLLIHKFIHEYLDCNGCPVKILYKDFEEFIKKLKDTYKDTGFENYLNNSEVFK